LARIIANWVEHVTGIEMEYAKGLERLSITYLVYRFARIFLLSRLNPIL